MKPPHIFTLTILILLLIFLLGFVSWTSSYAVESSQTEKPTYFWLLTKISPFVIGVLIVLIVAMLIVINSHNIK